MAVIGTVLETLRGLVPPVLLPVLGRAVQMAVLLLLGVALSFLVAYLFRRDGDAFILAYHGRLDDALNPEDEPTHHEMREAIEAVLVGEEIPEEFKPSRGCTIKWKPDNEPEYWAQV